MRKVLRNKWTFLVLLTFMFLSCNKNKEDNEILPFFNSFEFTPEWISPDNPNYTQIHTIPAFSFTNQDGQNITQKTVEGKIYVANFIFTNCGSICPKMTDNMVWLQDKIKDNPKVKLLSHSVFPDEDTVEVLKKYAKEKGVIDSKWNLVTGNQNEIYKIARQSYLVVKTGKPEELYDMVHTENFVLVDQKGRIRGFYNGLNIDKKVKGEQNLTQLLEDIEFLSEKD